MQMGVCRNVWRQDVKMGPEKGQSNRYEKQIFRALCGMSIWIDGSWESIKSGMFR